MSAKKKLHEALREIVMTYGHEIYDNPKLINYLNDYCQFEPMALYYVMRTILTDGYASKLLEQQSDPNWTLYVQQSIGKIQKQYGYQGIYVNYCFQSLAYGIGLYPVINQRLLDEVEGKQMPQPVQPSERTNARTPQQNSPRNKPTFQQQDPPVTPIPTPQQPQSAPTPRRSGPVTNNPINQRPSNQFPPIQPVPNKNGCSGGCMDDISSIFSIIIFILWILIQCS